MPVAPPDQGTLPRHEKLHRLFCRDLLTPDPTNNHVNAAHFILFTSLCTLIVV
jgi:hypothetical protein